MEEESKGRLIEVAMLQAKLHGASISHTLTKNVTHVILSNHNDYMIRFRLPEIRAACKKYVSYIIVGIIF